MRYGLCLVAGCCYTASSMEIYQCLEQQTRSMRHSHTIAHTEHKEVVQSKAVQSKAKKKESQKEKNEINFIEIHIKMCFSFVICTAFCFHLFRRLAFIFHFMPRFGS